MTPSTAIMVAGQKALANPTTRRAIIEAGKQILPYAGPIANRSCLTSKTVRL